MSLPFDHSTLILGSSALEGMINNGGKASSIKFMAQNSVAQRLGFQLQFHYFALF